MIVYATQIEEQQAEIDRLRALVQHLRTALEKIRFTEGVPRSIERIAIRALKDKP